MQVDVGALAAGQVEGLPYIGQFYPGVASLPGHGAPLTDYASVSRPLPLYVRMGVPGAKHFFDGRGYGLHSQAGVGPGRTARGRASLTVKKSLVFRCKARGCRALVNYQAAVRAAVAAGRRVFIPSDGCGARGCAKKSFKSRFERYQLDIAAGLRSGRRLYIRRPCRPRPAVVLLLSTATSSAAAAAIDRQFSR